MACDGLAGTNVLIELDANNRKPLRRLFNDYPCLHGSISAIVEGGMGRVFVDSKKMPSIALGVLDFIFLAGDPFHTSMPLIFNLFQVGRKVIAPTADWQRQINSNYSGQLAVSHREAFKLGAFDIDKLRCFSQALPTGFEMRKINLEEVARFTTQLAPALVYNFQSHEDFINRGVGLGILYQGQFVSGASSAAIGGGKLEFEVQTHPKFRRIGLARAVASTLILYCLEHGLEPCWDAANEASSGLANSLGFNSTGKYKTYRLGRQ